eukprot:2307015-Ditylum_brightwellii.AAC.1
MAVAAIVVQRTKQKKKKKEGLPPREKKNAVSKKTKIPYHPNPEPPLNHSPPGGTSKITKLLPNLPVPW